MTATASMAAKHLILILMFCHACHNTVASIFEPLHLACKCVKVTSKFILPANYAKVDVFPVGLACKKIEVIITLKTGKKICVNPQSKWVKNLLQLLGKVNEESI